MQPNNVDRFCSLTPAALAPDQCRALIRRAERLGLQESAPHYPPSYRDNDRLVLDDPELAARLGSQLAARLPASLQRGGQTWTLRGINPRFRICRYRGGQSFRIHRDGVHHSEDGARSLLTFMVYLNDGHEFEGGATRFFAGRRDTSRVLLRIEPEQGSLIVFDHALWHDGAPVTEGTKYVLRSDVLYEPERVRPQVGHRGYVWKVLALPGARLVSGGRDGTLRTWRLGERLELLEEQRTGSGSVLALAADGRGRLFSGHRDGTLRAWGGSGGAIRAHAGAVLCAVWQDDQLLTSGADGRVRAWSADLEPLGEFGGHDGWVWAVDGDFSAGEDGTVRRFREGEVVFAQDAPLTAVADLGAGQFATGDAAGDVRVGGVLRCRHRARVRDLLVQGDAVFSAGEDDWVRRSTARASSRVFQCQDFATSLARLSDGRLAVGSYDGEIHLFPSTPRRSS